VHEVRAIWNRKTPGVLDPTEESMAANGIRQRRATGARDPATNRQDNQDASRYSVTAFKERSISRMSQHADRTWPPTHTAMASRRNH